ncbi:MAG: biotin transporter BioY [Melioribacter sp.]|nr:biotin transporter BioY [Melioribacter sp.]
MVTKESLKRNNLIIFIDKINSYPLILVFLFAFFTFVGAQISIPVQPVPFTLQTMIVLLSGAFLGSRYGFLSQFLYVLLGALGLPVFAGFSFGLIKLFGPTGGYLLSFPFAAFVVGLIIERKNSVGYVLLSFVIGELLILFGGASYLAIFLNGNFKSALFSGALIFSLWDLIKIALAFIIYKSFRIRFFNKTYSKQF